MKIWDSVYIFHNIKIASSGENLELSLMCEGCCKWGHRWYLGGGGGVREAKNLNPNAIPDNLTLNGVSVTPGCAADSFAAHFHEKIRLNSFKVKINMVGVYNGKCKLIVQNRNFMTAVDVKCCLDELKKCKM